MDVSGKPVEIPAANLEVIAKNSPPLPAARQLVLGTSATNIFLGQPIRVQVLLPVLADNQVEALREVQFNGAGLMMDKTATRQSVEPINFNGQLKPAFIYETTVTPMAAGHLTFSAQAFTAGREFGGPISISGQVVIASGPTKYVLLTSEPLTLNVRPVPAEGELPGFTGALGKFIVDKPQLATNRLHVGEPVRLKVGFHGEGNLTRFVPPEAPRSRTWQIIADKLPAVGFTLIPLTDEVSATPAIPFCAFDPTTGKYADLTIPSFAVTVTGESLPLELQTDEPETKSAPLKLSSLALTPEKTVTNLQPLLTKPWWIFLQLVPVYALFRLWQWDERRRFLAAHPEIVRRQKAKQALRLEKTRLRAARVDGDAGKFLHHAAAALRIVCAPHLPAHPQALVSGDVLAQLDEAERNGPTGEMVRRIFAAADSQFASQPPTPADLLAMAATVEAVLQKLEARL